MADGAEEMGLAGAAVADGDQVGAGLDPVAGGERLDAGAGNAGEGLEVEDRERLAARQVQLDQVAANAAGLALGDLDIGESGEEAGGGPSLLVGALGQRRPMAVEARQAQRRQHGGQRVGINGARGRGRGGHAPTSSRASKRASSVSATGRSAGSDRRRGSSRIVSVARDRQATGSQLLSDQRRQLGFAGLVVCEPEQVDHAAAGTPSEQRLRERGPGGGVFVARDEAVAVDGSGQRLRLAAERVDDMAIRWLFGGPWQAVNRTG